MSKERPKLIRVKRPGNSDRDINLLRKGISNLKRRYPLILVKTPKITSQQVEDLFEAGASAWTKLASPEEGPPEPPTE